MRYVIARFEKETREKAYRIYVTDALKIITENTARYGGGDFLNTRWADIVDPQPADERTVDEVVKQVFSAIVDIGADKDERI